MMWDWLWDCHAENDIIDNNTRDKRLNTNALRIIERG